MHELNSPSEDLGLVLRLRTRDSRVLSQWMADPVEGASAILGDAVQLATFGRRTALRTARPSRHTRAVTNR